jgi:hypothetical protein
MYKLKPTIRMEYSPKPYAAEDIIEYLNRVPYSIYFFIDLEHPYFYTANSRLTLFADETRWAIVFEKSGYINRGFREELELSYYGNCLENLEPHSVMKAHFYNTQCITLIDGDELARIENDFENLKEDIDKIKVREQMVKIPCSKAGYLKWVPDILSRSYPEEATFVDLIRYIAYEYEELCRATEDELRLCIPKDLPKLMVIDEWHHRSYAVFDNAGTEPVSILGDPPDTYETYCLIAKVLENKDPNLFKPTLKPNNHWSNWPEAGSL